MRSLEDIGVMKAIFGIFVSVVCAEAGRMSKRMKALAGFETLRVVESNVSESVCECPQSLSELVSEFLPVATK